MARVVIVGPGAMGRLHAALLAQAGVDVILLDYKPERAAELGERGIILQFGERRQVVHVPVTVNADEAGPAEFVVLMVKGYATAEAAAGARAVAGEGTVWVTLQNGLGNVEQIMQAVGDVSVLAGVTTSGANIGDDGVVNVAAVGKCQVGPAAKASVEQAERFAALWRAGGLSCEAVADPWPAIWRKLIVNAAINPVAALAGRRNGELMEISWLGRLAFAAARETYEVALGCGIDFGEELRPEELVAEVCRLTASNRCSMLQDLQASRRTEIDFINGQVLRRARELGIRAPVCEALTAIIKAIEARE